MNHRSENPHTQYQGRSLLKSIGRVIIRIVGAGLVPSFGFWLMLASNMGPAYLPQIMNGTLDSWFRITLLGTGLGIWIITAAWLIWLILHYFYHLVRRHD